MVLLTSHKRRDAPPHPTKSSAVVVDCPGRPAYMGDNFNSRRRAKKFPTFPGKVTFTLIASWKLALH